MQTPTLETERLILRPLSLDDAPAIQLLLNDWEVVKFLATVPWPYPDDGAVDFLSTSMLPAMEDGNAFGWAITANQVGPELIGQIDYRIERGETVVGKRGFWLGKNYWGNGYMSEAVSASVDFVFGEAGLDLIRAENAQANRGSARIKEKTIGRLVEVRDGDFVSGRGPCEFWEISRDDWHASRGRSTAY